MTVEHLITIKDFARRAGLHSQTIYRKVMRGEIPAFRFGRTIRLNPSLLDNFPAESKIKKGAEKIPAFLRHFFWEYDFEKLRANDSIVIERVLDLGDRSAITWLFATVPLGLVKNFVREKGARRLSARSLNFWSLYFGMFDET